MHVSGDGYEQLNEAIQAASFDYSYRSTKNELISYYQETYQGRGQAGWKQHLVQDLARTTGMKPKNLERRFDPSRIDKRPNKRQQAQYQELGKQLPQKKTPKDTKGKRARVSFSGEVCYPSGGRGRRGADCRDKAFTTTLSVQQSNAMKRGDFYPIFDAQGMNPSAIDSLDVYSISVDFV
jgi:hypothetical protein